MSTARSGADSPNSLDSSDSSNDTSFTKCGYLKRKATGFGRWKEGWYVIAEGKLIEYTVKDKTKVKNEWELRDCIVEYAEQMTGLPNTFSFFIKPKVVVLRNGSRSSPRSSNVKDLKVMKHQHLFFQTSTKDETDEWVNAILKFNRIRSQNESIDLNAFNEAVVLTDDQCNIIDMNVQAELMYGWTLEEIMGQNVSIFIPGAQAGMHQRYVNQYHQTGETRLIGKPRRMKAKKKDNTEFFIWLSLGTTVTDGCRRFIATMRDVALEKDEGNTNEQLTNQMEQQLDAMAQTLKNTVLTTVKALSSENSKLSKKNAHLKQEMGALVLRVDRQRKEAALAKKRTDLMQASMISILKGNSDDVHEEIKNLASQEIEKSGGYTLLFRCDSEIIRKIVAYMQVFGADYLLAILEPPISRIVRKNKDCEFQPELPQVDLSKRAEKLVSFARMVLWAIVDSGEQFPREIRELMTHIRREILKKYPNETNLDQISCHALNGLLFLRYFVPAIIDPEHFSIVTEPVPKFARKTLLYIGKIIQHLANGVNFDSKEVYMHHLNTFLEKHSHVLTNFIGVG